MHIRFMVCLRILLCLSGLIVFLPACECDKSSDDDPDANVINQPTDDANATDDADVGDTPSDGSVATCCAFDARDVYVDTADRLVETIFANGKMYRMFHQNGATENDADYYDKALTEIPRFVDNTGPCAGITGACVIDAYSNHINITNELVEFIVAYGKYWTFTTNLSNSVVTAGPENGSELTSLARFMTGPCTGQTGANCKIETVSHYVNGNTLNESVTAYGKYWNFTRDLTTPTWVALSGNGGTLASVARYLGGPCSGTTDDDCVFESRTVVMNSNGSITESSTLNGRYYNFYRLTLTHANFTAANSNGNTLASVPRYAVICAGSDDSACPTHTDTCEQGSINCTNGCCPAGLACQPSGMCCATDKLCGNQCCGTGQTCNTGTYVCEGSCSVPCGDSCCDGTGQPCNPDTNLCEGGSCTPNCANKHCGEDNGCGGTCSNDPSCEGKACGEYDDCNQQRCLGDYRAAHHSSSSGVNSGCGLDHSHGTWTCRNSGYPGSECKLHCSSGTDCCFDGDINMSAAQSLEQTDSTVYCEDACNNNPCGECSGCSDSF